MPGCYARFPMPRFLRSHREATDPSKVEHCLAPGKDTFERAQPFLFVSWRCYVGVLGIGWVQPDSTIRVFAKAMLVNIYIYILYIYLYLYIYIYLQSLRSGQSGHLEGTSPVSLGGWIRCHGRKGSPGIHTRVGPNLCRP